MSFYHWPMAHTIMLLYSSVLGTGGVQLTSLQSQGRSIRDFVVCQSVEPLAWPDDYRRRVLVVENTCPSPWTNQHYTSTTQTRLIRSCHFLRMYPPVVILFLKTGAILAEYLNLRTPTVWFSPWESAFIAWLRICRLNYAQGTALPFINNNPR